MIKPPPSSVPADGSGELMFRRRVPTIRRIEAVVLVMLTAFILLSPWVALAQTQGTTTGPAPRLAIPIPGVSLSSVTVAGGEPITIPWIAQYFIGAYKAATGMAVILATVMIMVGGFEYVVAGSAKGSSSGKNRIVNAVTGLLVVLGAYLILNTINPDITNFKPLKLPTVKGTPFSPHNPPTETSNTVMSTADAKSLTADGSLPPGAKDLGNGQISVPIPRVASARTNDPLCFRKTFGATDAEIGRNITTMPYLGFPNKTVRVHKLAVPDFAAAFAEIEAQPADSAVGKWLAKLKTMPFYQGNCRGGSAVGGAYAARLKAAEAKAAAKDPPKTVCDSCDLHIWGAALDIDSCFNRYFSASKPLDATTTDMPKELPDIFEKHNIYWGGYGWKTAGRTWSNAVTGRDAMHYEWHGKCYQ